MALMSATFESETAHASDGPADSTSPTLHWNRVTVEVEDEDIEFQHVGQAGLTTKMKPLLERVVKKMMMSMMKP
jgi:hypothetical protein